METLRLFIAVNLDLKTREILHALQKQLIDITSSNLIRIIKKENLHLTLHFLGDINQDEIKPLTEIISETAALYNQFNINFTEIGCFPNHHIPGIIWAGITDKNKGLLNIHKTLSQKLLQKNFKLEKRPYKEHCTLAYVKNQCSKEDLKFIGNKIKNMGCGQNHTHNIKTISLISSKLTKAGAIYEVLSDKKLKDANN